MRYSLRFKAMGTQAHLLIDGSPSLLEFGVAEIERLEQLWSRFIPESEISLLNASLGAQREVSADTLRLIELAAQGWRETAGLFDPTLLNELRACGYDRDWDELSSSGAGPSGRVTATRPQAGGLGIDIDTEASTVSLAPEVGFDSGGIGKGLAADLVAERLVERGASGALVNLGGDLRVFGTAPDNGWKIDLDSPSGGDPLATLALQNGALATSSTSRRHWQQNGIERHHLIDPQTGEPATSDLVSVTVVCDQGWQAEVLAKAAFLSGSSGASELLDRHGVAGVITDFDGRTVASNSLQQQLVST